ncbi:MAG: hypothetical protein RID91_07640 [Azospirillaceae bacterium]
MTAEVAVLNKLAVALAADSKVTIGRGAGGKTYDTVNKLFRLSKLEPVGIMIYGNAEFMGFPWETIIKQYRARLGARSMATVREYAEDFLEFTGNVLPISATDCLDYIRFLWRLEIQSIENEIQNDFLEKLRNDEKIDMISIVREITANYAGYFDSTPVIDSFEIYSSDNFEKRYGYQIEKCIQENLNQDVDDQSYSAIRHGLLQFTGRQAFSSLQSGLVVAGFGRDEFFPSLHHYRIDGKLSEGIRLISEHDIDTGRSDHVGEILPLAQTDMVNRFVNGIDDSIRERLRGIFRTELLDLAKSILVANSAPQDEDSIARAAERASEAIAQHLDKAMHKARQFENENFAGPMKSMVGLLPKEELANLAESLVNLTSLQRRVSWETESVGGPVDVAVISKGDGFIWIRRKHYFDAALNPTFNTTYLRDTMSKTGEESDEH